MDKFAADAMLGKMAKWLRIAGFDVDYLKDRDISWLRDKSKIEGRTILTRVPSLAHELDNVFIIKSEHLPEQLREFFSHYKMPPQSIAFTRCVICNKELEDVSKENLKDRVPPYVFSTQEKFSHCRSCGRFYWAGTHYQRMKEHLTELSGVKPERLDEE